jgi:hypothetical protein
MAVQTSARTGHQPAPPPVAERQARATRGVKVLAGGVVAVAAGVAVLVTANKQAALVWAGIGVLVIAIPAEPLDVRTA